MTKRKGIDRTCYNGSANSHKTREGTGWHYSHLEGKVVCGYQVHAAIVGTGDSSLFYSLKRCCPEENGTKINMTLDIIRSLPDDVGACVLMDSWYTNPGVLDACREKGCHLIGAMKTNRILYPDGKRTSASALAASLDPGCFHPVTVKGRTYMVYRYEGVLNKIDHAVVLLSYPLAAFGKKSALRVFLCPDSSQKSTSPSLRCNRIRRTATASTPRGSRLFFMLCTSASRPRTLKNSWTASSPLSSADGSTPSPASATATPGWTWRSPPAHLSALRWAAS